MLAPTLLSLQTLSAHYANYVSVLSLTPTHYVHKHVTIRTGQTKIHCSSKVTLKPRFDFHIGDYTTYTYGSSPT
jgi:hypothetical protein